MQLAPPNLTDSDVLSVCLSVCQFAPDVASAFSLPFRPRLTARRRVLASFSCTMPTQKKSKEKKPKKVRDEDSDDYSGGRLPAHPPAPP